MTGPIRAVIPRSRSICNFWSSYHNTSKYARTLQHAYFSMLGLVPVLPLYLHISRDISRTPKEGKNRNCVKLIERKKKKKSSCQSFNHNKYAVVVIALENFWFN